MQIPVDVYSPAGSILTHSQLNEGLFPRDSWPSLLVQHGATFEIKFEGSKLYAHDAARSLPGSEGGTYVADVKLSATFYKQQNIRSTSPDWKPSLPYYRHSTVGTTSIPAHLVVLVESSDVAALENLNKHVENQFNKAAIREKSLSGNTLKIVLEYPGWPDFTEFAKTFDVAVSQDAADSNQAKYYFITSKTATFRATGSGQGMPQPELPN